MRCSVAGGPRFFKWKMLKESGAICSASPTALDCTGERLLLPLETSALHPSTPDESSSMKSACPAKKW